MFPLHSKEALGGRIEFDGFADFRIYNKDGYGAGLNMSRSIGDLNSHSECGLIADPEVGEYQVTKPNSLGPRCNCAPRSCGSISIPGHSRRSSPLVVQRWHMGVYEPAGLPTGPALPWTSLPVQLSLEGGS